MKSYIMISQLASQTTLKVDGAGFKVPALTLQSLTIILSNLKSTTCASRPCSLQENIPYNGEPFKNTPFCLNIVADSFLHTSVVTVVRQHVKSFKGAAGFLELAV